MEFTIHGYSKKHSSYTSFLKLTILSFNFKTFMLGKHITSLDNSFHNVSFEKNAV